MGRTLVPRCVHGATRPRGSATHAEVLQPAQQVRHPLWGTYRALGTYSTLRGMPARLYHILHESIMCSLLSCSRVAGVRMPCLDPTSTLRRTRHAFPGAALANNKSNDCREAPIIAARCRRQGFRPSCGCRGLRGRACARLRTKILFTIV